MVLPQLLLPAFLAGDPAAARVALLFAVSVNVPVALAARLDVGTSRFPDGAAEWLRTLAAWGHALVLVSLLSIVDPAHERALLTAVASSVVAGIVMYVAPSGSTPQGMRLRLLRESGGLTPGEQATFTLRRCGHVLAVGVVPAIAVDPLLSAAAFVGALGCLLTLQTIRRITADRQDLHRHPEHAP